MKKSTVFLLIAVIALIAVLPMLFNFGDPAAEEPFAGTDAAAEAVVAESNPDYEAWFEPLVGELPGEVESGLFALQAALGAGVVGFTLGHYRARHKYESARAARSA